MLNTKSNRILLWASLLLNVIFVFMTFSRASSDPQQEDARLDEKVIWIDDSGHMFGKIQVMNLEPPYDDTVGGRWPIPKGKRVVMEIGANNRNTMEMQYLPVHEDAFLITLEPLLDKFAHNLVKYPAKEDNSVSWAPLGHHHQRGIILPFAVGPTDSLPQSFNLAKVDGCSSLLPKNPDNNWIFFKKYCSETNEVRTVPVISLEHVLERLPDHVDVDFLKIDAQGFDLEVVRSAGAQRHRIKSIMLETVTDFKDCTKEYLGQPSCREIYHQMLEWGFQADPLYIEEPNGRCFLHNEKSKKCETDLFFHRPGSTHEQPEDSIIIKNYYALEYPKPILTALTK